MIQVISGRWLFSQKKCNFYLCPDFLPILTSRFKSTPSASTRNLLSSMLQNYYYYYLNVIIIKLLSVTESPMARRTVVPRWPKSKKKFLKYLF